MTKNEALATIKALRDKINDEQDTGPDAEPWTNEVCFHLDAASDVIEFPPRKKVKAEKK